MVQACQLKKKKKKYIKVCDDNTHFPLVKISFVSAIPEFQLLSGFFYPQVVKRFFDCLAPPNRTNTM